MKEFNITYTKLTFDEKNQRLIREEKEHTSYYTDEICTLQRICNIFKILALVFLVLMLVFMVLIAVFHGGNWLLIGFAFCLFELVLFAISYDRLTDIIYNKEQKLLEPFCKEIKRLNDIEKQKYKNSLSPLALAALEYKNNNSDENLINLIHVIEKVIDD